MQSRLERADAMLADQQARLVAVIASDTHPTIHHLAKHYLAKVESWQRQPDGARDLCLGLMGPNGYAPAIDDVCWQAEFHTRPIEDGERVKEELNQCAA